MTQVGKLTDCGVKVQYFASDDQYCKIVLKKDIRPNIYCRDVFDIPDEPVGSGKGLPEPLLFAAGEYVNSHAPYEAVDDCNASFNDGYFPVDGNATELSGGCDIVNCFAATEKVHLENQQTKPISDIAVGDRILSVSKIGQLVYSDVIAIAHPKNDVLSRFIVLETASDYDLKLTEDHLIMSGSCRSDPLSLSEMHLMKASAIDVGMCVQTTTGVSEITYTAIVEERGVYSVVTNEVC